jgi:hypothetical protein
MNAHAQTTKAASGLLSPRGMRERGSNECRSQATSLPIALLTLLQGRHWYKVRIVTVSLAMRIFRRLMNVPVIGRHRVWPAPRKRRRHGPSFWRDHGDAEQRRWGSALPTKSIGIVSEVQGSRNN